MPKDEEIRLTAAIDAQTAKARQIGAQAAGFFNEVTKGCVSSSEAVSLTGSFVTSLVNAELLARSMDEQNRREDWQR